MTILKKILIIEDDLSLSNGVAIALKNSEFTIIQGRDLNFARVEIQKTKYDLIILDINLPDGSGLDFLKELRKISAIPVIMLTAKDMETDVVTGFEFGADDYITKPFSLMILRARVQAQLRKVATISIEPIQIDGFSFCFTKMEFLKHGVPIELSKTEQKLLRCLLENKGHTLERSQLIDIIWTNSADYVDENALSVTVKRLRDKLEDLPSSPKYIKTVYGVGYAWAVI